MLTLSLKYTFAYAYYIKARSTWTERSIDFMIQFMRSEQFLAKRQIGSSFIPTPENKELIINYFKYNNFQDFNTWQQIAKTKLEYTYLELPNYFQCNLVLNWDDRVSPLIYSKGKGHSKRTAKRRALAHLIQQLICKAMIYRGFKQENFVQNLPRRRKNFSDQSSSQEQTQKKSAQSVSLQATLRQKDYQSCIKLVREANDPLLLLQCWRYAVQKCSLSFCGKILSLISQNQFECQDESKDAIEEMVSCRQFQNGSQVKFSLNEDLTDFIRYFQLSKDLKEEKMIVPEMHKRRLPTEELLKAIKGEWPNRNEFLFNFHPIQRSKLILDHRKMVNNKNGLIEYQPTKLPVFQEKGLFLHVSIIQKMYYCLLFQAKKINFCIRLLQLMEQHFKLGSINFALKDPQKSAKAEKYYLKHKKDLTTSILCQLNKRLHSSGKKLSLQGMLLPAKPDETYYQFVPNQSEEYLNLCVNKRVNLNEFQEMSQFSIHEIVEVRSKFTDAWIGHIVELSTGIRLCIPSIEQIKDPHPVTLVKLFNSKLFQKTSDALIECSKECLHLFQANTHLIWQPPTFPVVSAIAELLIQWQTNRQSILIISPNSKLLHNDLNNLGFKSTLLTTKADQKTILKSNIVVSQPDSVCCDLLKNYGFSRVIVDEAHSLPENSILSGIVKDCKNLWLIGDPFLPLKFRKNHVKSLKEQKMSLFLRLMNEGKSYQTFESDADEGKLHNNVLQWVNKCVYKGNLRVEDEEAKLPIIKGFPWPSSQYRICLLHTKINEQYKQYQTQIATTIIKDILKTGYITASQICCLSTSLKIAELLKTKLIQKLNNIIQDRDKKNVQKSIKNMVGVPSGSRYDIRQVSILLVDHQSEVDGLSQIVAWLVQGRRGAILIADIERLSLRQGWSGFIAWAKKNKLICSTDL